MFVEKFTVHNVSVPPSVESPKILRNFFAHVIHGSTERSQGDV